MLHISSVIWETVIANYHFLLHFLRIQCLALGPCTLFWDITLDQWKYNLSDILMSPGDHFHGVGKWLPCIKFFKVIFYCRFGSSTMCYSCCTHCIHHITFNVLQAMSQDTDYYIKSFYLLVFYKLQWASFGSWMSDIVFLKKFSFLQAFFWKIKYIFFRDVFRDLTLFYPWITCHLSWHSMQNASRISVYMYHSFSLTLYSSFTHFCSKIIPCDQNFQVFWPFNLLPQFI